MSGRILIGDCRDSLRSLPDKSVHCCVTSPPYFGLRDYGHDGQIGREGSPEGFLSALVGVFRELRRVLRDDGTLWLNLGDSYAKDKNRLMIPARAALALQADGWILRDEVVWHKPRTTPAPVKDRTVSAHEMLYLFSKQPRYAYDYLAIEEPSAYGGLVRKRGKAFRTHGDAKAAALLRGAQPDGVSNRHGETFTVRETRRKRSVWSVSPSPYKEAHFATYPPALIEPCILAGCPIGGTVIDPFFGAGTTGLVAEKHGRNWIGCELNPDYADIAQRRIFPPIEIDPCSALFWAIAV